jgi:hypothetical protein
MVPLSALANFTPREGPEFTMCYDEYRSAQINGSAAPGYSSDQATAAVEQVFKQSMLHEMGFDYMGMSYQEQKAREGMPAWGIFAFPELERAANIDDWVAGGLKRRWDFGRRRMPNVTFSGLQ